MDRNQKICFGFIIIYIGISLLFMISVFLLINGLPIDDFILFFNKINENLDIESINNIILRINDNFDFIYFTTKKISNLTNNIDNFKDTAETINTQLTNYNETIYYLTDNIDNFKDYSNKLNNTMFEIISTIRYFQR